MSAVPSFDLLRRHWAADWLERLGRELDLTDAQLEEARDRYEAVGRWLGAADHPWLAQSTIFAHGSIGLGLGTKPLSGKEFDVDLIQNLVHASAEATPAHIKALVGNRLKENAVYAQMLDEMPRCWRLNYANAFHLDISPTVPHPEWPAPALYIPDRRLRCWKPTNPIGFRELFERRARLTPRLLQATRDFKADVAEFPLHRGPKGILRRVIQLLKHHRDLAFQHADVAELRPISVVITTLAARAYEYVVLSGVYETDYDLLLAIIEHMPQFIEVYEHGPQRVYVIANETVAGENFAEKWNADPRLAKAFYDWHARAASALRQLVKLQGQDQIAKFTSREFGAGLGERVLKQVIAETSAKRSANQLSVHATLGVGAMSASSSTQVRSNTFFES